MKTRQNSSMNSLYQALTEIQLAQIQGGITLPQDLKFQEKLVEEDLGTDLTALNTQRGRDHDHAVDGLSWLRTV